MTIKTYSLGVALLGLIVLGSCTKDTPSPAPEDNSPTPYVLETPKGFPTPTLPADNPLTVEGIELGRHLFYDSRMSIDESISCSSCHSASASFTDTSQFSEGVNGAIGTRNAMPIFNMAWSPSFMWDGAGASLFNQVLIPLTSHIEMAVPPEQLDRVLGRFQSDQKYVEMYKAAFGTEEMTFDNIQKALVQFELSMVSANSKYDKVLRGEASFTADEEEGRQIFLRIDDSQGAGECQHCHFEGGNFSDGEFRNNGLDAQPMDLGRGKITLNTQDNFKFKTPSLRNLSYTYPYMHDGRFATIEEVLDFYNTGIEETSPNLDPNLAGHNLNGRLSNRDKSMLIAFLKTLDDPDFINNPAYQDPN